MGEAKSAFGDRDVRSTADNLVMVSKRYTTETAKLGFDYHVRLTSSDSKG